MALIESMTTDAIVEVIAESSWPPELPALAADLTAVGNTLTAYVKDAGSVAFHVKNTGSAAMSSGVFAFEASVDSTDGVDGTWFSVQVARTNDNTIETGRAASSLAAGAAQAYAWEAAVSGYTWFRIRCTTAVPASSIGRWTIVRSPFTVEPVPSIPSHQVTVSGSVLTNGSQQPSPGSEYSLVGTASTNAQVIKSLPGQLMEISVFNPTAAIIYLKIYNKGSAPTVGTDVPRLTIPVPVNGQVSVEFGAVGKRFGIGIAIATTTGPLATDTTAPTAGIQISSTHL